MAKVALSFGCAKQSKNLKRYLVHTPFQKVKGNSDFGANGVAFYSGKERIGYTYFDSFA